MDAQEKALVQQLVVAIGNLNTTLRAVLPAVQSTAASATTGASGVLPSQVAGYFNTSTPNGSAAKVPYYNP